MIANSSKAEHQYLNVKMCPCVFFLLQKSLVTQHIICLLLILRNTEIAPNSAANLHEKSLVSYNLAEMRHSVFIDQV